MYCTRRERVGVLIFSIYFGPTKISISWFWLALLAAALRRSWINFFRSSLADFVSGIFDDLFCWGWSCFRRSSMIRGRLLTEFEREKERVRLCLLGDLYNHSLSFGSYSSMYAHCLAFLASSLANFSFTLSINGKVISQKPSRSLSSGIGSPVGVIDLA